MSVLSSILPKASFAVRADDMRERLARLRQDIDDTAARVSTAEVEHGAACTDAVISGTEAPAEPKSLTRDRQRLASLRAAIPGLGQQIAELQGKARQEVAEALLSRIERAAEDLITHRRAWAKGWTDLFRQLYPEGLWQTFAITAADKLDWDHATADVDAATQALAKDVGAHQRPGETGHLFHGILTIPHAWGSTIANGGLLAPAVREALGHAEERPHLVRVEESARARAAAEAAADARRRLAFEGHAAWARRVAAQRPFPEDGAVDLANAMDHLRSAPAEYTSLGALILAVQHRRSLRPAPPIIDLLDLIAAWKPGADEEPIRKAVRGHGAPDLLQWRTGNGRY